MQIDTDAVEKMAREYNQALSNYNISDSSTNLLEKLIILSENQLDIINFLLCCPQSRYCSKILNYLKTLKTNSIINMNRLLDKGEYIASFRNPERALNYQNSYMKLVDLQIDIFVLLDKLSQVREDIENILILENRSMAVISVICR
ncbi:MAG: hypothetical protein ACOCWI_02520 [Bacillota bacterium]